MTDRLRAPFHRRAFLGAIAAPVLLPFARGIASASSPRAGTCVLTPEQEAGPFYLPAEHMRGAIAEGKTGVPLAVRLRLLDATSCMPIEGAAIDIWHCDALGAYSGFASDAGPAGLPPGGRPPQGTHGPPPGFPPGPPPGNVSGNEHAGPPPATPTNALTFLRGTQITDRDGFVHFASIFPGFYPGRVNHIHLKVHAGNATREHVDARIVHTGQLFFPESLASEISKREPYARHRIERTSLQDDHVFTEQHGPAAIADVTHATRSPESFVAALTLGIDPRRS